MVNDLNLDFWAIIALLKRKQLEDKLAQEILTSYIKPRELKKQ
jgi:hypothetical protein